jgi:hypothetical protein
MAGRTWTLNLGIASPSVAGTGLVTDGATDPGSGFLAVTQRDTAVGNKQDIINALRRLEIYLLSESSTYPPS